MVLESVHVRVCVCIPTLTDGGTARVRHAGRPNRLLSRLASYGTERFTVKPV